MGYNEFEVGEYGYNSGWNSDEGVGSWDLYENLIEQEAEGREIDLDNLVETLVGLPLNPSYNQKREVLENFGWLLKRKNTTSFNDNDTVLSEDSELVQNLIDIHEKRIKDDDSIDECFQKIRKLFED